MDHMETQTLAINFDFAGKDAAENLMYLTNEFYNYDLTWNITDHYTDPAGNTVLVMSMNGYSEDIDNFLENTPLDIIHSSLQ